MSFTSCWLWCSGCRSPEWRAVARCWLGEKNDLALRLGWGRGGGPAGLPGHCVATTGEVLVTGHSWFLLVAYSVVLLALAIPMGRYIANVMEGKFGFLSRVEGGLYRV